MKLTYITFLLVLMLPLVSASVTINSLTLEGESVYYGSTANLSVDADDNESRPLTYSFYLRPSVYFTNTNDWSFNGCNSASNSGSGLTDLNICECSATTTCTGYANRSVNITNDFLTLHWYIDNNLGDGNTTATMYVNSTMVGQFSIVGTSQIAENKTVNLSRYAGSVQELKLEVEANRAGLVTTGTLRYWFDQWGDGANNSKVQSLLVQNTTSNNYTFSANDRTHYISPFQYDLTVCNNESECASSNGHNFSFADLNICNGELLKAVHFVVRDEETNNILNGTVESTVSVTDSQADNTDEGVLTFDSTNSENHSFCIFPSVARPSLNNFLTYESLSTDHTTSRAYYFENTVLNPLLFQNFDLFLLNDTDLSSVSITIRDSGGVGLANRLFKLERYSPSDNTYTNVDMCETGTTGACSVNAHLNKVFYRYQVKSGESVLLTSGTSKLTDNSLIITIATSTNDSTIIYSELRNIVYTLKFYNDTNTFDLTFSDTTNAQTQACLDVDETSLNSYVDYDETCVTSNSGSIIINLTPVNGTTYRARALFTIQGEELVGDVLFKNYSLSEEVFNELGAILVILLVIVLLFVGIYNPSVSAVLMALGFIMGYATGLLNIGLTPVIIISALSIVVVVVNKS